MTQETNLERAVIDAALALMDACGERRQQEAWHALKDACNALKRERIVAPVRAGIEVLMAMREEEIDRIRRDVATDKIIEKLMAMSDEKREAMFAAYRRAGDPAGIKLAEAWDEAARRIGNPE